MRHQHLYIWYYIDMHPDNNNIHTEIYIYNLFLVLCICSSFSLNMVRGHLVQYDSVIQRGVKGESQHKHIWGTW